MKCTKHRRSFCLDRACRAEKRRRESTTTTPADDLNNPASPLGQVMYGGMYYGTSSSPDCGPAPTGSGHDSGGSSSSYDSGSSASSSDCGGGF